MVSPYDAWSPLSSDASSLAHELFVPEVFAQDNLPEHLTTSELHRSISHMGDLERLHCFLEKLRAGNNVSIGVVGGSVSAGSSSMVRTDQGGLFHKKMQSWLQRRFPRSHITHFNAAWQGPRAPARSSSCGHPLTERPILFLRATRWAREESLHRWDAEVSGGACPTSPIPLRLTTQAAMPAVPPDYMQHCVRLHVPQDADLIFLEAAANMCGPTDKHGVDQCAEGRASVERILRQLLRFPNAPAVVVVHAYPYWTMRTPKGWSQKAFRRKSLGKAGAPPKIPWLVPKDFDFEFHQQWGHGPHQEHVVEP